MPRKLDPHFSYHIRETHRTKRRFTYAMAGLSMMISLGVGLQYSSSQAATASTVSLEGAIIDASGDGTYGGSITGIYQGASVTAKRISTGVNYVSSGNPFALTKLPSTITGDRYTISISPLNVKGYILKGSTWCESPCGNIFSPQATNFHSGASVDLVLRTNVNYQIRWIYEATAIPVSGPVAAVLPKPISPAPRSPVPNTASSKQENNLVNIAASDTLSPLPPSAAQALSSGTNAIISLSWGSSVDDGGLVSYRIDRSIDRENWTIIKDKIIDTEYIDDSVAYSVNYYYRIYAVDQAGNISDNSLVEASTGEFSVNSSTTNPTIYSSNDNVLSVSVPGGTLTADAKCSVEAIDLPASFGQSKLVAGPYELVCKDSSGMVLADYRNPIEWSYSVKGRLGGLNKPNVAMVEDSGTVTPIQKAKYDSKLNTVSFKTSTLAGTLVLASSKTEVPWNFIVVVLAVLIIIGVIFVLILRRNQKVDYDEYLRSKYYNL